MTSDAAVELARLGRRLNRERAARAEAESIAESTLSAFYETVQDLAASRALLDETTDFVAILDAAGRPVYLNRAICELFGIDATAPYDVDLLAELTPQSRERFASEAMPALEAKDIWRGEFAVQRVGGQELPVSQVLVAHRDEGGRLIGISSISRDVTEQRELTNLLAHRSLHDVLTGLPNRRLLYDRLDLALARAVRIPSAIALLFMDVDGFKLVNDTYGHVVGDQLLIAVADRLIARMRTVDTLARVGGDEFVLLCEAVGSKEFAAEIAQRLIEAVAAPIDLNGTMVEVTMSVGVALVLHGTIDSENLVRQADDAMYAAKHAGRGCFRMVVVATD